MSVQHRAHNVKRLSTACGSHNTRTRQAAGNPCAPCRVGIWQGQQDSNPRQADYESVALPAELQSRCSTSACDTRDYGIARVSVYERLPAKDTHTRRIDMPPS